MNASSIKLFCDVVRFQSFSEAAEENGITQAAVSQNIRQLENRLGTKLIDRNKRPFVLTEAGSFYYEGCRDLVEKYYAVENELRALTGDVRGKVRLAAIYSAGISEITTSVQHFTKVYPGCTVGLSFLHPDKVHQAVLSGEADLGIVSYPKLGQELSSTPWRDEKMVLVFHPGHSFANAKKLRVPDLNGQAFVAFDMGLTIRKEIDRYLRKIGVAVNVKMTFDNLETIKRAVALGEGVAILPEHVIESELADGVLCRHALPKDGPIRPLAIIYKKNRLFFRAADRFVEMMIEDLQSVSTAAA